MFYEKNQRKIIKLYANAQHGVYHGPQCTAISRCREYRCCIGYISCTITLSEGNSYSQENGVTGTYTDSITITGTSTTYTIIVASGEHNIILSDVDIEVSDKCAFDIQNTAIANITLVGVNVLTSGDENAGLQVQSGATVVIDGEGSLDATGSRNAAGIGGGYDGDGGTITIKGGTVTATGGQGAAGIGGGSYGDGGTITIEGGTVIARGGETEDGIGGENGAGIGGGSHGDGGIITIKGGTVTAIGGRCGAGIGGGYSDGEGGIITIEGGTVTATGGDSAAGIGGGIRSDDAGTIFSTGTDGNAFIIASSISDNTDTSSWSGVIFQGDSGVVYSASIALQTDATVPNGRTLAISDENTLTLGRGITFTNEGEINNGGIIYNYGTIANNGTINNSGLVHSGYGEFTGDIPVAADLSTYIPPYSKEAAITAFEIAGQVGDSVIDTDSFTVTVTMPYGTDVTALTPTIKVSDYATINPISETSMDFTNTVTYTVTAQNDTITQDWEVTVVVEADPDIAIVEAACDNAENTDYADPTEESDYADESALASYIESIATAAIDDETVTVTVNTVSYTAETDGVAGSYIFTITVSKGTQSETTTEKTVVIPAGEEDFSDSDDTLNPDDTPELDDTSDPDDTSDTPDTGDNSNILLLLVLALASLCGLGFTAAKRKI